MFYSFSSKEAAFHLSLSRRESSLIPEQVDTNTQHARFYRIYILNQHDISTFYLLVPGLCMQCLNVMATINSQFDSAVECCVLLGKRMTNGFPEPRQIESILYRVECYGERTSPGVRLI